MQKKWILLIFISIFLHLFSGILLAEDYEIDIVSVLPEADAIDVQVDSNITITFADTISTSDNFGAISIIDENEVSTFDICHKITSQNKLKIYLNVDANWAYATTYTVTIPANAVKDFSERPNSAFSFSFSTVSNYPQVVNNYPEINAVDVPCSSNIIISYDKEIQLGTNSVHLFQNDLSGNEIPVTPSIDGSDLIIQSNTLLQNNTQYYVHVPPGAVESLTNAPMQTEFSYSFTTEQFANYTENYEIDISSRIIEKDSNSNITITAYPQIAGREFEVKGSTYITNDLGECVFSITPTAEELIPVKLFNGGSWVTVGYIHVVNSLAESSLLRVKFIPDFFRSYNENRIYIDDMEKIPQATYCNYADYIVTTAAHNIKFSGFDTESCSYIIDEDIPKSQEYLLDMTTLSLNTLSFTFNNAPGSIDAKYGVCELNETVSFCLNLDDLIYYSNNILEGDLLIFQNICFEDYQTSSLMQMSNYIIDTQGNAETTTVLNLAYNSVVIESSVFGNQKTYYAYLAIQDEKNFFIDNEQGSCFTVQLLDSQGNIIQENQGYLIVDTTNLVGNYDVHAILDDNPFYPIVSGQLNESFSTDSISIVSIYPEADATDVQVDSNITITFADTITTSDNFGDIKITDDSCVSAFDICQKFINQNKLKFDLSVDANWAYATTYTVTIPANAVKDFSERPNSAFSFSFSTVSNYPQVVNKYPDTKSVEIPCSNNIIISFDKDIQLGTNSVQLFQNDLSGNEIPVTPSIDGSDLIIQPNTLLQENTQYYVYVPPGAVESLNNAPLKDGFSYSFTTEQLSVSPTRLPANYYSFRVSIKANSFTDNIKVELIDPSNTNILSGYSLTGDDREMEGVLFIDSSYNSGNGLIAEEEYTLRILGSGIDFSKNILATDQPIIRAVFPAKITPGIPSLDLEFQGYNFDKFNGNELVALVGVDISEASTDFTVNNSQSAHAQFRIQNSLEVGTVLKGSINYPDVIYYEGNYFAVNISNDAYIYKLDRSTLLDSARSWTSSTNIFSFTGYNIDSSNISNLFLRLFDSNRALVAQLNFDNYLQNDDCTVTLTSELFKETVALDGYYEVEVMNEEFNPIGPTFGFTVIKPHISRAEVLDNKTIKIFLTEAFQSELFANDFQVIQETVKHHVNSLIKSPDNLEVILFLAESLAEGELQINNISVNYDSSAFVKVIIDKNIATAHGLKATTLKDGDILYNNELLSTIYISSPVEEIFITFAD